MYALNYNDGKIDTFEFDRCCVSCKRVERVDSGHSSTECVFHQFKDVFA